MAEEPELETLKDLKQFDADGEYTTSNNEDSFLYKRHLKQLVIKWIKEIRRLNDFGWNTSGGGIEEAKYRGILQIIPNGQKYEDWAEATDLTGAEKVLRDIFNIEENELK